MEGVGERRGGMRIRLANRVKRGEENEDGGLGRGREEGPASGFGLGLGASFFLFYCFPLLFLRSVFYIKSFSTTIRKMAIFVTYLALEWNMLVI